MLVKVRSRKHQYLLIVKYQNEAAEAVRRQLMPLKKVLKNKTSTKNQTELTYEVQVSADNTAFVTVLSEV